MKVSVITATWNSGKTVQDTIDAILRQQLSEGIELEHVIKDGSSQDDTVNIIKRNETSYAKAGKSLRWVSEKDEGIYDAMNKGG